MCMHKCGGCAGGGCGGSKTTAAATPAAMPTVAVGEPTPGTIHQPPAVTMPAIFGNLTSSCPGTRRQAWSLFIVAALLGYAVAKP